MIDIDLPEVQSFAQQPRFFKDGGKDYVEISFLGAKDTVVKKVTPDIMAKFRDEWNAYCDGKPLEKRKGTPLTVLPEISEQMADEFVRRNLHTLEELAVLSDHQCQGLGHGLITLRRKAIALVQQRQFAEKDRAHKAITSAVVKPAPEENNDITELKSIVAEQGKKIDVLIDALTKLAEPKKKAKKNGTEFDS